MEALVMKNEMPPAETWTATAIAPATQRNHADQLDLTLLSEPAVRRVPRRQRPCSRERARWWFAQMRRVVDEVCDAGPVAAR
ncbi:MAG: hypothetical protein WCP53_01130 [Verrucomicrobiota bacterium]